MVALQTMHPFPRGSKPARKSKVHCRRRTRTIKWDFPQAVSNEIGQYIVSLRGWLLHPFIHPLQWQKFDVSARVRETKRILLEGVEREKKVKNGDDFLWIKRSGEKKFRVSGRFDYRKSFFSLTLLRHFFSTRMSPSFEFWV